MHVSNSRHMSTVHPFSMQERFEFLAQYRHVVPEEDFEVAMKAYEWPKKFVSIMKEAATKATSGMLCKKSMSFWLSHIEDPVIRRCPIIRREKKRKDYAFWRQFDEKPIIVPGCPGLPHHTSTQNDLHITASCTM